MRSLVVYETGFGNTAEIARAVGEGLLWHGEVTVADVRGARPEYAERFDLLVVGAPARAFSLARGLPSVHRHHPHLRHAGPQLGLREWLRLLPEGSRAEAVAAFDTRPVGDHAPGSAAGHAAHLLRRRGYLTVGEPATFYVQRPEGPVLPGERVRAVTWGDQLGALVRAATVV
ncbi:MAG: hypothetical protein ACTHOK_03820 [Nocardioidaceae bacterium]